MYHSMAYRNQAVFFTLISQECGEVLYRTFMSKSRTLDPVLRADFLSCRVFGDESRRTVESLDLPPELNFEPIDAFDKHRKLDARRARIKNENYIIHCVTH